MRFRILAIATLFAPLWLTASVRAETALNLKQLQDSQSCSSCNAIRANEPVLVAQSGWKKFSSAKGRFAALMPGQPTEKVETEKTEDGPTEDHTFSVETEEAGFMVMYSDAPAYITKFKPDALLDEMLKEFSTDGSKVLRQRRISLGAYPGIDFEYKTKDGVVSRARSFLVGQRMYILQAITSQASDAQKFLDSFELTLKQP